MSSKRAKRRHRWSPDFKFLISRLIFRMPTVFRGMRIGPAASRQCRARQCASDHGQARGPARRRKRSIERGENTGVDAHRGGCAVLLDVRDVG